MAEFTLIIGSRNYSSWSLRGWLACREAGLTFDEEVIVLGRPDTATQARRHSPSGMVPVLKHGAVTVWDSLAIVEYAHEVGSRPLWPDDRAARAMARSAAAEMHSGFRELRQNMPMNIRANHPGRGMTPGVQEDVNRITALWRECRKRYGAGGPFLFGGFGATDIMYAPVVTRLLTYAVSLDGDDQAYCQAVMAHPSMAEWVSAAKREPWIIDKYEV